MCLQLEAANSSNALNRTTIYIFLLKCQTSQFSAMVLGIKHSESKKTLFVRLVNQ
uniref:Uncharacterized protein n=1 Tax=Arion vulgaris TaxID=1028688 RepID=A0A0B7AQS9_9EUPU